MFKILTQGRSLVNEDHDNAALLTVNKGRDSVKPKHPFQLLTFSGQYKGNI